MCQTLFHRGPDDQGFLQDGAAAFGMRRLSIIDLASGHQPISNEAGTIWVVFNGEIYNYRELRRRLEALGHRFRTHSDTEVIVHAYEQFGDDCVSHFNGMFALAIWDSKNRRGFLARDRIGIKPLFYSKRPTGIIFGSELKSVLASGQIGLDIDLVALDHFLALEYIPAPRTIFHEIKKLLPGCILIVDRNGSRVERYWELSPMEMPALETGYAEQLSELIRDAVRLRLISDVPLGAFLSGGIDSSAIVSYMTELASGPVQTFTIGFEDQSYDETNYARMVAEHFGTHHHEEVLKPDIASMVEPLIAHFDEPFADFSIFPTYLISAAARKKVKVVLSGDGGDEIFAGYDSYVAQSISRYYRWMPAGFRRNVLPALLNRIPPGPEKKGLLNRAKRFVEGAALPESLQHTRWMIFLSESERRMLYRPELRENLNGHSALDFLADLFGQARHFDPLAQQQVVDIRSYLAEDILTKVDRMSMAVSLEARVPLLDHRIVEFAVNLPPHLKLQGTSTKRILREVMSDRLPPAILNKPKEGFSIPIKHWLGGPLREVMMDTLAPDSIRRRGYFDAAPIQLWIQQHLSGKANHSHRLWALIVFELWHRQLNESPIHRAIR